MRRFGPLLGKLEFRYGFKPYHQRIQDYGERGRQRQLPFLQVSKEPSIRPAIPDPRRRCLVKVDLSRLMNIMVGDRVRVLYGSDKGKEGIVGSIDTRRNQVIVRGMNMKRSFWHPEPGPGRPSIMSVECPIHITNVALLDPVTKRPTRVKRRYMMDGECVRISKVSGCAMPEPVPVSPNEREELYEKWKQKALLEAKERRGPMKEDVFGNKQHFQALVRIMRTARAASQRAQSREE
mmetsp:Transcript_138244/g.258001  ORF Transcript_138244/g.258001 Transcript_138244/m.258001 type:complete len:236 (+) Transcript_138244:113-820(+)